MPRQPSASERGAATMLRTPERMTLSDAKRSSSWASRTSAAAPLTVTSSARRREMSSAADAVDERRSAARARSPPGPRRNTAAYSGCNAANAWSRTICRSASRDTGAARARCTSFSMRSREEACAWSPVASRREAAGLMTEKVVRWSSEALGERARTGRGALRRRNAQRRVADAHGIAGGERRRSGHGHAVQLRAVARRQVFDEPGIPAPEDPGVPPRHAGVRDGDVHAFTAADEKFLRVERRGLGRPAGSLDGEDEGGHVCAFAFRPPGRVLVRAVSRRAGHEIPVVARFVGSALRSADLASRASRRPGPRLVLQCRLSGRKP